MVKQLIIILCIKIVFVVYGGIPCYGQELINLTNFHDIVVQGIASDKKGAFCENFKLSVEQVDSFFKRSKCITTYQLHNEFEWLPCYVYGVAFNNGVKFNWEIRLIGIGKITNTAGMTVWLGCKNCDDLF